MKTWIQSLPPKVQKLYAHRFWIALIIGLTVFITRVYFQAGVPLTHDGENHLARFANYYVAVKELQLPPRFAPNLFNHFGYPVFNFNYPLANILSLPGSVLDFHYQLSFKLIMIFFVLLGLSGTLALASKLKLSRAASVTVLLVYGLSPYLWSTIWYRGNIGEVAALGMLPWVLAIIEHFKAQKPSYWLWLATTVFATMFLLSHNVLVVFSIPVIGLYSLLRLGNSPKKWGLWVISWIVGFGLSAWFWIPAWLEKSYTVLDEVGLSLEFLEHFPTLTQLLFSPVEFGYSQPGKIDSLSFSIGLAQALAFVVAGIVIFKNVTKKHNRWISIWWLVGATLLLSQLECTKPLWQSIEFTRFIQFPWRLTAIWVVASLPIIGLSWSKIPKSIKTLIWALLLVQAVGFANIKPLAMINKPPIEYELFAQSSSTIHENRTPYFEVSEVGNWEPKPFLSTTSAQVTVEKWTGSSRTYRLKLPETTTVTEQTMWFPGWETQVIQNKTITQVSYLDQAESKGLLSYRLEPGEYQVTTNFTQNTFARMLGNGLTVLAGSAILIGSCYQLWKKLKANSVSSS